MHRILPHEQHRSKNIVNCEAYVTYADHLVLRNLWISSSALSLALLGDALLYVILPLHAEAFGISLAMVGFLLAINRIIAYLPMASSSILPSGWD